MHGMHACIQIAWIHLFANMDHDKERYNFTVKTIPSTQNLRCYVIKVYDFYVTEYQSLIILIT